MIVCDYLSSKDHRICSLGFLERLQWLKGQGKILDWRKIEVSIEI